MIDAHAHLGYEGYTSWGSENYSRENLIEHLERYAYYGFGAVFSAGSDPEDLAIEIQLAQREGQVEGARFLFGAGMAPPGQGPNNQFLGHALAEETGMTVLRGVASEEEGRTAVREVSAKEIPFIKIWVDDRGGEARRSCRGRSIVRSSMRPGRMASRSSSISRTLRICRICSRPAWPVSFTVASAR